MMHSSFLSRRGTDGRFKETDAEKIGVWLYEASGTERKYGRD